VNVKRAIPIFTAVLVFGNASGKGRETAGILPVISQWTAAAEWHGTHKFQRIGYALSGRGDVNGDGYADFVVGSPHTSISNPADLADVGSVYLILGGPGSVFPSGSIHDMASAVFYGGERGDAAGGSAMDGDVNGDGLDDILIGAPARTDYAPNNPGHAYLVFGRKNADWGKSFVLNQNADVVMAGEKASSSAGYSFCMLKDMNLDGCDEFMIGSPDLDGLALKSGKVYLFKGRPTGNWPKNLNLPDADAIFLGTAEVGRAGASISGIGDVNGDGIADFCIHESTGSGRNNIFFGRRNMDWGKSFRTDQADVIITGAETTIGGCGGLGDVNSDGLSDFAISAPQFENAKGKIHLFFGRRTGWQSVSIAGADATFLGEYDGDMAGWGVSDGADVNGDGCSDFLIGAWLFDKSSGETDAGKAYLINGRKNDWSPNTELGSIQETFIGRTAGDVAGFAVNLLGDINRDGSSDWAVSAPYQDTGNENCGRVYLFLGPRLCWNVQGTVLGAKQDPVRSVLIKVNGDSIASQSDAQGVYSFLARHGRDYTLAPAKARDEDVGDAVITAYDAALAARFAMGLETLDGVSQKAADANNDGAVQMIDAVEIVRYAVGLKNASTHRAGDWFFEPPGLVLANIQQDQPGQNFTARIRGDVNGSWGGVLPKGSSPAGWTYSIRIQNDALEMAFDAGDAGPVLSVDAVVEYDDRAYAFSGVPPEETASSWNAVSSVRDGVLRLGAFVVQPEEGNALPRLRWRIQNPRPPLEKPFIVKRFCVNDERIVQNEVLRTGVGERFQPADFSVSGNFPNPFNPSTDFRIMTERSGFFTVDVVNQRGETVKGLWSGFLDEGRHPFHWDGKNGKAEAVPSGLYLFRISDGNSRLSMKALLVR
jgi:hypothetical protein